MTKSILTLLLCFASSIVFSQSPGIRIDKLNLEKYCLGSELSIDVSITGVFPIDNKFTVVAFQNWDDPAKRWEYPAVLKDGKLITTLTAPELTGPENFNLKILSSNPGTESGTYYSLRAYTKAKVRLLSRWGYSADTLTSTDALTLSLVASPTGPGEVTLNTGDKFTLHRDYYSEVINVPKTKEGTYFIKEASNACGAMDVSGQVGIKVNSIDFMPIAVYPEEPCGANEIKVNFSTANGEFGPNTKFRIRFADDNGNLNTFYYRDSPAILTGQNELTAKVPGFTSSGILYIGIVTENPSSVSINKALRVYVSPKPSVSLTSGTGILNLGEETWIGSGAHGKPPYKVTLTTGETFGSSFQISPEKTTQYQVKTYESGCGVLENPPNIPLTITVRPGLLLAEKADWSNPKVFCEGQTVRMRYRAVGVTSQTSYILEGITNTSEKFSFPAKAVGDSLEFFIPTNPIGNATRDYGNIYALRIVSTNPILASPNSPVKIQSRPSMITAENSQTSVPFPSAIRLDYTLFGGGPYTIEMADGTRLNNADRNFWYYQFIKKDTTFKLSALSNQCFRNSDPPSFALKVISPGGTTPSLFVRLLKKDYCMGDNVEVELYFNGTFQAGNQFSLSYSRFAQIETFPIQNLTKAGTYKVKLPIRQEEGYDASIQFSSSQPRLVSETERFFLTVKPGKPSISPQVQKAYPEKLFLGESPRVVVYSNKESRIDYSVDGREKSILTDHNGMRSIPLELTHGKVSEFKLHTVTNSCGSYNGEIFSYFLGVGYKIVLNRPIYANWHCVGSLAELQFAIESGVAAPGTRFTLQISGSNSADSYTDIATITEGRVFSFTVPGLTAGNYYVRVRSADAIISEPINFLIGEKPVASLHAGSSGTPRDTTMWADYGSQVYLTTWIKGNTPWGILYNDGKLDRITDNNTHYAPTITTPQTFSISKVWNSCGYGTASGSVTVKVKPVLELKKYPENTDGALCAGQKIQLDYLIKGADLSGSNYLVFSLLQDRKTPIKLDSVSNLGGRIELRIPESITGQFFSIKGEMAQLQVSKSIGYQIYSIPDITLSGDNLITAGETSVLYVRANNSFANNTSFQLSDGSAHVSTAPFAGGVTEIKVAPPVTTTYTLRELKSTCGTGKVAGSATITVQPKLSQWLSVERISGLRKPNICNTDTILIYFNGSVTNVNAGYEAFMSDSTGKNFVAIQTTGQASPVTAVIPAGTKQSNFYKIRLTSKDPAVSGSTFSERLKISEYVLARVMTPEIYYNAGKPAAVVVSLEGTSPYYYRYGDDNVSQYRSTTAKSDTIRFIPVSPAATYRILQAGNECGTGKVGTPSSFSIELITGAEPLTDTETVVFGPNPTGNELFLKFEHALARELTLLNSKGAKIYSNMHYGANTTLNMQTLPPGTYLLVIKKKDRSKTYKIIKY